MLLLLFVLGALATPVVSRSLARSLSVSLAEQGVGAPEYIFVLGGGYVPGDSLEEDILVIESTRRVLAAVSWWREYPQAKIVFSGAEKGIKNRRNDRSVQLMAEIARGQGVPEFNILIEGQSRNTREHPIKALELPGMSAKTPIGVVTSNWHMRRAQREFCRYFSSVRIRPVLLASISMRWQDFIPHADTLWVSAILLQEWVGGFWYDLFACFYLRQNIP